MSKQTQTFVIDKEGNILTIYDDSLAEMIDGGGEIIVKRASHVEPQLSTGCRKAYWYADLSPVGGPLLDGFNTRQEALTAELDWLNHHLPELEMPE